MSARAVGASLLRQMEQEELIDKCTLDAFCVHFAQLVAFELSTMPRNKYDLFSNRGQQYVLRETLWKQWLERTRADIEHKYDRRVAQWGDWWSAQYGELNVLIVDMMDRIARGVCECTIGPLHDEALGEDLGRALDRDLFITEDQERPCTPCAV